jgi:ferritin-like metal-binding protein YciE
MLPSVLQAQVVAHLHEAHALEQNVLRIVDCLVGRATSADLETRLRQHREETEGHLLRLKGRLADLGHGTRLAAEVTPMMGSWLRSLQEQASTDTPGLCARDSFVTEQVEIAFYHLLERLAHRAGDGQTVRLAAAIRREEEAMADWIAARWDQFLEEEIQGISAAVLSPPLVVRRQSVLQPV